MPFYATLMIVATRCVFQLMDALSQETGLELNSKDEAAVSRVTDRVNQVLIFGPGEQPLLW